MPSLDRGRVIATTGLLVGQPLRMRWCLSWWTPNGWEQVLLAVVFWGALLGLPVWWLRRRHRMSLRQVSEQTPAGGSDPVGADRSSR